MVDSAVSSGINAAFTSLYSQYKNKQEKRAFINRVLEKLPRNEITIIFPDNSGSPASAPAPAHVSAPAPAPTPAPETTLSTYFSRDWYIDKAKHKVKDDGEVNPLSSYF